MRQVIALGGNALLKRGEPLSAETQKRNVERAAASLVAACEGGQAALVHGNGPQIGLLALQAEAYEGAPPYPLDVLGAESQGMIGYVLTQALNNAAPHRQTVTVMTRTLVNPGDPAFRRATKPIGPVYPADRAQALAKARGWTLAPDGAGLRRTVASPEPIDILEAPTISNLVAGGVLVVCTGGGGVPVARGVDGLHGVEAVIDKDLAAALLAVRLDADRLIILTDVDAVYRDWGTPQACPIRAARVDQLAGEAFGEGTMEPKVRAACRFASQTGRPALIGALDDLFGVLTGSSGTRVLP